MSDKPDAVTPDGNFVNFMMAIIAAPVVLAWIGLSIFLVVMAFRDESVVTDIDTDCGDYSTSVLIYVDVWHEESGDYAWRDITMNVDGMNWDDHWLNFTFEELNETEGTWSMWVALLNWDEETEDYIFQQQFEIPMIRVEAKE